MSFEIIRNDITQVHADAIVNTANPKPVYGGGCDYAIYQAAGADSLLEYRKQIGEIEPGDVKETPALKLHAKYIFHTVGPEWIDGKHNEFDILRSCYEKSLKLAVHCSCKSIAFPLLATGVYGFPKDKALQIAMSSIQMFLMEHEMNVILVVLDPKSFELTSRVSQNIKEYVQTHSIQKVFEDEYQPVLNSSYRRRKVIEKELKELYMESYKPKVNIKEMIQSQESTFQEKLFEYIDQRGLSGPEVYKEYISKQTYSKILCDKNYHPSKYIAIALCLSLHLNLDQSLDLISRAGWTLSKSAPMDLVVRGCIMNGEYNLVNVNIELFNNGCDNLQEIK